MRQYETAFLIAPNLPEEDNEKLISQMAEVVSKKKGKMVSVDEWGKRKLAYPIQKFEEAYYVFFLYEGDPSIPVELERRFKQTETIIRYMTVKNDIKESAKKRAKTPPRKKRGATVRHQEKISAEGDKPKEERKPEITTISKTEPKESPKEKLKTEPVEEPKEESKATLEGETKKEPKVEQRPDPAAEAVDKAEEKTLKDLPAEAQEKKEK